MKRCKCCNLPLPRDIGARVKMERVAFGMTQGELARAAGVGQRDVSFVENGIGSRLSTVHLIAQVFGITAGELINLPNSKEND